MVYRPPSLVTWASRPCPGIGADHGRDARATAMAEPGMILGWVSELPRAPVKSTPEYLPDSRSS